MPHKLLAGRRVQNKKQTEQTELYYGVNKYNIDDIFTYNFGKKDDQVFGAKAVAIENFKKEIDICFFAQGKGRIGNNVHHRDVYANMIEAFLQSEEFKSYEKLLRIVAEIKPLEGAELVEATKKIFASSEVDIGMASVFVKQVIKSDIWDSTFIPLLEVRERFEEFSALTKQRSNENLSNYQMFDAVFSAQGYQFSARRTKIGMVMTSAQMDSSLTSIHKRFSDKTRLGLYQRMNDSIMQSIERCIRSFTTIDTPKELQFISD